MSRQSDDWPFDEYARFPDGSWGAWVRSVEPHDGDLVDITLPDRTVVHHLLMQEEWGGDTLQAIAQIVIATGRELNLPGESS